MGSGRLRVMTLNCLLVGNLRARLRVIGSQLGQIGADVTCLQEVFWQRDLPLLPATHKAYQPRGPLVMGGLVTLTSAPIESTAFDRYALNGWLERLAWVGRMGLLVSQYRHAGEPLTVVNTHLPANYDEDWSETNRFARRQAAELDQLAQSLRRIPLEGWLVVAGDFNVPAPSRMFKDFLVAAGLVSAVDWAAWSPTGRVYHGIDNVLYRPRPERKVSVTSRLHFRDPVQLADGRMLFASDHAGIEVDLEW
ncbi:MAG TPA: endonuclease/exonuclease/phosphatase family protein [Candidatus Acidoferrum sp.]|nr:endonuclease/exonuclease/phosphatase family protein [Candidatus Acidoferrum sp.]